MRLATSCRCRSTGSKSWTSAAILTGYSVVSKRAMRLTPDRPARSDSRNGSLPMPMGDTTPMPVTTTRFSSIVLGAPLICRHLLLLLDAETAVDRQHRSRDERGRVAGQEGHRVGHRLGAADAAQRDLRR